MTSLSTLNILYRDDFIAVIVKPGGLLAVPGRGPDKQDCVTSRLRELIPSSIRQPAVHRLDMATSGIMVLALTKEAHAHLSQQFASRQVEKKYIAVVEGTPAGASGEIQLAFRLDPDNRPHQVYDPVNGKLGITKWQLISSEGNTSRLELYPHTGRTHQLRVHAAHELGLHCPIIGDPLYGKGKEGDQLMLHAAELSFYHPDTEEKLVFISPPPF